MIDRYPSVKMSILQYFFVKLTLNLYYQTKKKKKISKSTQLSWIQLSFSGNEKNKITFLFSFFMYSLTDNLRRVRAFCFLWVCTSVLWFSVLKRLYAVVSGSWENGLGQAGVEWRRGEEKSREGKQMKNNKILNSL